MHHSIKILLSMLLLIAAWAAVAAEEGGTVGIAEEAKETVTLSVAGMTCENCVKKVTAGLKGVDGVSAAAVDLDKGEAVVTAKKGTDVATLVKAVTDSGFKASQKKEAQKETTEKDDKTETK